jgi:hypothetical protein
VYELYDLESDPSELKNISGAPEYTDIERELRIVLAEKTISDVDYLPLPNVMDTDSPPRIDLEMRDAKLTHDR